MPSYLREKDRYLVSITPLSSFHVSHAAPNSDGKLRDGALAMLANNRNFAKRRGTYFYNRIQDEHCAVVEEH